MTRSLSVVAVLVLLILGSLGGIAQAAPAEGTTPTANTNLQQTESYVIEQGDSCQPIEPLSTTETVESFYDYRNHETHPETAPDERQYSSYGTTHLQADNTSILFLHEGTDGLSLVMVHDRLHGDTEGGVVSFDIVGLPAESEWVVQDDRYGGDSNMAQWYEGDGWVAADWIWSEARTDGGAVRGGLNDEFAVTIQPAFNEDAAHYDNESLYDPGFFEDGEIENWEVLSGVGEDPDRTTLSSLEEPVTIRTGSCDDPAVTYDRLDDGDGIAATIQDATVDDQISLQPTSGTAANVTFERIELNGIEGSGSIAFENRQPNGLPASPDGVESLSQLTTSNSMQGGSATVTFSVEAALLEHRDLEPEDVALYEGGDGEWTQVETTVSDESPSTYRFTADVSSLEGLTVAEQRADLESHSDDGSSLSMPGFAASGALVALLLLLWGARRRT